MPKEHFRLEAVTPLSAVPAGGKIHVIGVAGVAMAQLAVALALRGYAVSGSDKDFYEPMGSFLRRSPVRLLQGYSAENIPADVDLVVIGNAVSYGHPEVAEVESRGLRYTLFPKLLYELAIQGKHSIVVTGTHGKTTTTALGTHVLTGLGQNPSFFIGGAVPGLDTSLIVGTGPFSIVEGDEYDSAFFAKVPKFSFYEPNTLIVTAIEYDHADIYPSLDSINQQFEQRIKQMAPGSHIVVCADTENVRTQVARWRKQGNHRYSIYGRESSAEYQVKTSIEGGFPRVSIVYQEKLHAQFTLQIPGEHNALNAAAVFLALTGAGLEGAAVEQQLSTFGGVRRRQEIRWSEGGVTLVDDFAHHPTAVRETLWALSARFPGRPLVAIFEPRSNTSRRKVFQKEYVDAFQEADRVFLCNVTVRSIDPLDQLIDVAILGEEISATGVPTEVLPDADQILARISQVIEQGWVLVVMSNGGFGGLVQKLEDLLRSRFGK